MPQSFRSKPLLLISFILVISDVLFIVFNYYAALNAINKDTEEWGEEVQHVFMLTLDLKATSMQQIALYVAKTKNVQELFYKAKEAYESKKSEIENSTLDNIRKKLYDYVIESWTQLTSQYDIRQLHFHFGPGSTSFLRVHSPEKYGDNMDDIRYTIVDTNQFRKPVKGFETGRIYCGIRGVVPVIYNKKDGVQIHVGALEAGTSFTSMLNMLHNELKSNLSILLTEEHVKQNMWPDFIENHYSKDKKIGKYYIEYDTNNNTKNILTNKKTQSLLKTGHGSSIIKQDGIWQICIFPLRDYRGTKNQNLPAAGAVLVSKDASKKWALFKKTTWNNILYSIFALIFLEIVLVVTWNYSQKRLNKVIKDQTDELERLATHDGLTGTYNRRCIEESTREEIDRAVRYKTLFSVIMFDIDHFKKVNDVYGHSTGDMVLKKVCENVKKVVRSMDKVGRWGGEEFLVLAPQTPLEKAASLAERIRVMVATGTYGAVGSVTISLGAAMLRPEESMESLVKRVDEAMYQAKNGGRNKVVVAN